MILAARGGHRTMSHVTCQISVSLDGFVAGPNQSLENPLGEGGDRLHEWAFATASWREQHGKGGGEHTADADVADAMMRGVGAFVMGRKMFGGGDGPWDEDWRGWWGEDPPFHAPVFVLIHHPREPLEMQGGTTFHFVTAGIEKALERAFDAANGGDVRIGGGAATIQQYLRAGLIDEMHLVIVPILLGSGERLFQNLDDGPVGYACVQLVSSPSVAHVRFSRSPE
jgi:dihydrofolate reductase